ncbi:hypothetical protein MKK88_26765 [Methylobacterium sp. E-005]|uniref:hypothetical protein n=1 Tax=Methylobacterium sp. E-005 TaxID=2836549 RepID=UPI001FB8ABC2|nr:hypothetical protein [Methylobacterium sp. E-005]MCJ2089563.1 hypothetical protein [Methylobacterium sp. E-005]
MRTTWRLLALCRPHLSLLVSGIALNVGVVLAHVEFLAVAGGFAAAMALAGLRITPSGYFALAAAIRGLARLRTSGRYRERLVTHEATLAHLATLRVRRDTMIGAHGARLSGGQARRVAVARASLRDAPILPHEPTEGLDADAERAARADGRADDGADRPSAGGFAGHGRRDQPVRREGVRLAARLDRPLTSLRPPRGRRRSCAAEVPGSGPFGSES